MNEMGSGWSALVAWMNENSTAVQALATVVLVVITAVYAHQTRRLARIADKQLSAVQKAYEPDVSVLLSTALVPTPTGDVLEALNIRLGNKGAPGVTVQAPSLRLADGRQLVFPSGFFHQSSSFPTRLEQGDVCDVLIELAEVTGMVAAHLGGDTTNVTAEVRDGLGNVFESEPVEVDARRRT